MTTPRANAWIWPALVLLVAVAAAGRWSSARQLFDPRFNPARRLSGDEIVYIALGDRLFKEGVYSTRGIEKTLRYDRTGVHVPAYLEAPLFKHPPVFPFMTGLARLLCRGMPGAAFIPGVVLGAASIAGLFWLARECGLSPPVSLGAASLLAISPEHWICSARVWMDAPLTAFILVAVAAHARALNRPCWWMVSGVFWGLALLTKYTALAAWAAVLAGTLVFARPVARTRAFWAGQATAVVLFIPWLALRFWVEGWTVLAFWQSGVEDWRSLALLGSRAWWVAPAIGAAGLLGWRLNRLAGEGGWNRGPKLLAAGTVLFVVWTMATMGGGFFNEPWHSWGENLLKHSPRFFYLAQPLRFEPVCWWGMLGMLTLAREPRWDAVRFAWVGLFLFLTCWGNFQSRYGLPLLPFELLAAAGVLAGAGQASRASRALAAGWVVFSAARSIGVIGAMAFDNQFFYF